MPLRDELTHALRTAMKDRDRTVASALRTALGELANAEAIPTEPAPHAAPSATGSPHVAGAAVGVGATEAARRTVSESEQRTLVERQRAELLDHAARLTQLCRFDEADGARRAAETLRLVLTGTA